jgi:hypothetical protein
MSGLQGRQRRLVSKEFTTSGMLQVSETPKLTTTAKFTEVLLNNDPSSL